MPTTTQLPSIQHPDFADYAGDYADDYDLDAIAEDYREALMGLLPDGIYISRYGDVFADLASVDDFVALDLDEIAERIDVAELFQLHERT